MKIAICFGTRPEIIKLYLLSRKMALTHNVINVFTGQHHSLYNDVKHLIPNIHYSLPTSEYPNMSMLYIDLMKNLNECFQKEKPDLVIVQGDTASAYCASLCAFFIGIKVGHVEAGLRTHDLHSPFPEEFNRQSISLMSNYHWCPTELSFNNLKHTKTNGKIILTGNTIVDAVNDMSKNIERNPTNRIIITLHRRENKDRFNKIAEQINIVAEAHKELEFLFPAHPNPIIQKALSVFTANNINIISPMPYEKFISEVCNCRGIITDSGGIQEEAICFNKKVLICRNDTERSEGIGVCMCSLIRDSILNKFPSWFEWLIEENKKTFKNPYGDGNSCDKIIESLKEK